MQMQMQGQAQGTGSRTQTETRSPSGLPVLRLRGEDLVRGAGTASGRRIQWADDVVDNEGLGRKSSKG